MMEALEGILDLAARPADDLDDETLLEAYREVDAKLKAPGNSPVEEMYLIRRVTTLGEEIMDRGRSLEFNDGTIKYAESNTETDE